MADEEKPPEIILEIDNTDTESAPLGKALEVAAKFAPASLDRVLGIEKMYGLSRMTDIMRMMEENSSVRRMADSLRLFEESSGIKRFQDQMRLLGDNSAINRIYESTRLLADNSAFKRITDSLNVHGELARAALGPAWELRNAGLLDIAGRHDLKSIGNAFEGFEARFRLPELSEAAGLTAKLFHNDVFSSIQSRYAQQEDGIRQAIERMNKPWLDIHDAMHSVTGFAQMQGIGQSLRMLPGFGEKLSTVLRVNLGDWRDLITWRPEMFTDLQARSDFYVDRGFNPALTDFPLPAFEQGLDIAGLRNEPPPLVALYGPPIPASEDTVEEQGLVRTNVAHNWLQRLERVARKFIDEEMTRLFGREWPKRRLPHEMYEQWRDKKRIAQENGEEELPLIAYADFTDYVTVICKRDNWREVFEGHFGRAEDVRESFQRLYPIRLDTAHARLITQDDELLLYVEAKRLVQVMMKRRN
jgi:hypothetical protein